MKNWLWENRYGLSLFLLAALILLPFLGAAPLIDPDEPVYGQTAKEMLAAGDWLMQQRGSHHIVVHAQANQQVGNRQFRRTTQLIGLPNLFDLFARPARLQGLQPCIEIRAGQRGLPRADHELSPGQE